MQLVCCKTRTLCLFSLASQVILSSPNPEHAWEEIKEHEHIFDNKLTPFAPSSRVFGESDFHNWVEAHLSHSSEQKENNDM